LRLLASTLAHTSSICTTETCNQLSVRRRSVTPGVPENWDARCHHRDEPAGEADQTWRASFARACGSGGQCRPNARVLRASDTCTAPELRCPCDPCCVLLVLRHTERCPGRVWPAPQDTAGVACDYSKP